MIPGIHPKALRIIPFSWRNDAGFCIFAGDNHFVDANRETSI